MSANSKTAKSAKTSQKEHTMKKNQKTSRPVSAVMADALSNLQFVQIEYVNGIGQHSTREFLPLTPITEFTDDKTGTVHHNVWGLDTVVAHDQAERVERDNSTITLEKVQKAQLLSKRLELADGLYACPSDMRLHFGALKDINNGLKPANVCEDIRVLATDPATGQRVPVMKHVERPLDPGRDQAILREKAQAGWTFIEVKQGVATHLTPALDHGRWVLVPFVQTEAVYVKQAERRFTRTTF